MIIQQGVGRGIAWRSTEIEYINVVKDDALAMQNTKPFRHDSYIPSL